MAIFLKLPEEKKKQKDSALQIRRSHNVIVVQSISSLLACSQKKYVELLIMTIIYYWKVKQSQATLSDVIYLLPYFSLWINAFKWKTNEVVFFEQVTRATPTRFFFLVFSPLPHPLPPLLFTPLPPPLSLFLTVDSPLGIKFSSPQPSAAIKIKDGGHNIRYEITKHLLA